ncbi:MAG: C4-dicarboxylate ABC transporter substrate-binding protein [Candidatus Aminicenantes bacterium]|nr:C4-dicarboxylate ABC transporter substrate-binding protein [Candidatus Aminicenantes bacterium]NIM83863.1 C4-dicarboxylate ABC transporter substrate-binding protein [Candidatus Aminicenantes bacterium]NIN23327.1 C4-dicarboxylate ABC transporter substrate-binding protein [Candidatus Aminicenantes bacterium]NIN47031.1 C4-dicarboxylate ABC transporter substrate-binding protein [Candidatus Aminicenantes bacterium]NIN89953.1 C4-dicarboxylate ABC transporter substrate-binding protein [Candidatus A
MRAVKSMITLILVMALVLPAYAFTIKIGSSAPERSPWHKALRELARQWKSITNGLIELKIYPGGIAGNEADMVRKMRMGILGGAVVSNKGFISMNPDIYVLNIPFLITTEGELNYVLDKMKPAFGEAIKKKGFKLVIMFMAGWVHFFTRKPVNYPDDLKKHKLAFTPGESEMEQTWKKSGYHIVPTDLKDLLMALQSGMVNAFLLPPLLAGSGQYFPLAPHMSELRIAPLIGGMVLSEKTWKRIPEKYREKMMQIALKISGELYEKTVKLEKEAIEAMKKHGLKIVKFPDDSLEKWRAASAKGMDQLIGKAFSKEIYDRIIHLLEEYRKKNASN